MALREDYPGWSLAKDKNMKKRLWLCCGVLKNEMEFLKINARIAGDLVFFDSMLHMQPENLEAVLGQAIHKFKGDYQEIVIIYGDCCPLMYLMEKENGVARPGFVNCAQMLVGREAYRKFMKQQSYLILPEWLPRWREVFSVELGLNRQVATCMMQENRSELVYLDTGLVEVQIKQLIEWSEYVGLPYRIEKIDLSVFANNLNSLFENG
ncbi:MAG: DUF1638 domain-containing protein [Candidatus Rifleibacteriota bacterium]